VPGPGNYTYTKPFGTEASKYTMRGKGNTKPLAARMNVPGPGEYGFIAMNPPGKYIRSNFKNATTIVWASSKEKRFQYQGIYLNLIKIDFKNPGPGAYEPGALMNGKGTNFISKFKNNPSKTMSMKFRATSNKNQSNLQFLIFKLLDLEHI
jgi:hypothetical protein